MTRPPRLLVVSGAALALAAYGGQPSDAGAATAVNPPTRALPSSRTPTRPPTEADFVGYPSCLLYLDGTDTRLRVRAQQASSICKHLADRLSRGGATWSLRPRRARQILSPICRMADPHAVYELDVIDDATGSRRGPKICGNLARTGWFNLSPP